MKNRLLIFISTTLVSLKFRSCSNLTRRCSLNKYRIFFLLSFLSFKNHTTVCVCVCSHDSRKHLNLYFSSLNTHVGYDIQLLPWEKRKKKKKRILESNCKVVWLPRCVCVLRSPRHPYGFSTSYSVISAWVLKTKEFIWATIKIKVETIVKKKKLKDNLRFVRKRAVSYGSTLKKKEAK